MRQAVFVLDFSNGQASRFFIDSTQTDQIEEILIEKYGYRLKDIEYMISSELSLKEI